MINDNSKKIDNYNDFDKEMKLFESKVEKMCHVPRPTNVLIVSGDPGIGKSYRAEKIIQSHDEYADCKTVTTSISPVGLYQYMWQNNDQLIVLDDVNNILKDANEGASLLKASTNSEPRRLVKWGKSNYRCVPVSKMGNPKDNKTISKMIYEYATKSNDKKTLRAYENGQLFPDMFYFTGAVIILTNKPLSKFDTVTEGAVSNRGDHMEISLSLNGSMELIKHFAPNIKEYNGMKLNKKSVNDVIKFLTSDKVKKYCRETGKILTLRNFGKIAASYQVGEKLDDDMLTTCTEYPYHK